MVTTNVASLLIDLLHSHLHSRFALKLLLLCFDLYTICTPHSLIALIIELERIDIVQLLMELYHFA